MIRRLALIACLVVTFVWTVGPSAPAAQSAAPQVAAPAGPIKLARHPDYHAGKIAFSYLGDIWTANEDGSASHAPHRQHGARGLSALLARRHAGSRSRRTATATTTSSSIAGHRRRAAAADVPHRQRRGGRLVARLDSRSSSAPRAATAPSRTSRRCTRFRSPAGPEKPLPVDWGYWGDYSPDGKSLVFNRHPVDVVAQALSRQLRRRPLDRRPRATKTYTTAARRRAVQPLLADVGRGRRRSTSWPIRCRTTRAVKPGSPEVRKSVNNIYRIPASGSGQPVQVTKHTDGSLFWPSMSSDGKVIVYEDNFGIWKLDVAIGPHERDQDRHRHRREGERGRGRDGHERGRRLRPLAVRPARGHLGARPDPHDRDRARRHHAHRARQDGLAQPVAEVVARRQVHRVRLRSIGPRRDLDRRSRRQEPEEDHRPRQREGRARVDAGFEVAPLHGGRQEALQLHRRRRQDRGRHLERRRRASARSRSRPTASGWRSRSRTARCARTSTSRRSRGGEERHVSDDSAALLRDQRRSGPPTAATSSSRRPRDSATASRTQGGITTHDGAVGAAAAGPGSRSAEPRHRQRGAGAGGAKRPRGRTRRRGGGARRGARRRGAASTGTAWRGARGRLTVPGDGDRRAHAGARRAHRSRSTVVDRRRPAAAAARAGDATPASTSSTSRAAQLTRVPPAPRPLGRRGRGGRGGGGGGRRRRRRAWCSRATAARCTSGRAAGSIAAPVGGGAARQRRPPAAGGGGGRGGRGGGGAAAAAPAATSATARQVTYTVNSRSIRRRCARRSSTRAGAS